MAKQKSDRRSRRPGKVVKEPGASTADRLRQVHGPSPNPMTNLILADIALRGSGRLMRRGIERLLLGAKYPSDQAGKIVAGKSMKQTLLGTALARIATRSLPGAMIVGGGMVAKTLYDRTKSHRAKGEGEQDIAKQLQEGKQAERG